MPITIELDRGQGPYKGGDLIAGKVIVINSTDRSRQLSYDLTITFLGKAWTQWKEGRNSRDTFRQYLVSKWEIETYFNQSFLLLQPGNMTATRTIDPGITELPFIYQLPPNLPGSFWSKHGGVTYTAQVLYRRPWKWDKLVQRDINVQGSYNLSWYPITAQPGYFTLVKKVWCGLGKVKANLLIQKRGFVPGEEMHFKLELDNDTRMQLKKIRVYLVQITTYSAQTATRQEIKKCIKLKCPSVQSRQSLTFPGCIVIPLDLPPTNLGSCRIVQPRYSLLLKIKTGLFGKTCFYSILEGRVPISIGTAEITTSPSSQSTINCHLRRSNHYSSNTTLPNYEAVSNEDNSSTITTSLNHLRLWNLCTFSREDYDSDPPPSYEDALALPPVEESCNKYRLLTS
ncbi:unnamed protein product [Orchesella dallaii]|uniref:Arrestin C-terminal-like domain-containing protein n=1 Tax=Orchesella dallaii TaxID=48710 RepID=A0ABP1QNY9_9HEXA